MSGNTPLRFLGVGNMLDREYRNSPAYQWARELARNGIEAKASTIQFGVEWQGVEATGTYRLQYADDGEGMTREHLRDYMVTLGKGSKVVGGPHDNYALGSRMTLLPWNPEGVVVISVVNDEAFMVKMKFDADAADGAGEYVLAEESWIDEDGSDGLATVYPPYYDEELGLDWADTIPEFILKAGHGTTFTMLGRHIKDDTLNGDSERNESIRFLTRKYFNARFWDLPETTTLRCIEFVNFNDRGAWPKSGSDRDAFQFRGVKGAKSVVEYVKRSGEGSVESSGTVALSEGTKAHWWLRNEPTIETGGVGTASGMIAVLYRGELYGHAYANSDDGDTRVGAAVYRQFGIGNDLVRKRVVIIIEPAEFNELTGDAGVAPSTGRADLYWMGAGLAARSVKPADWSEEFAARMPDEIEAAIDAAHEDSRQTDDERDARLRRVMDRLKKRWRVTVARPADDGDTTTEPKSLSTPPRTPIDSPSPRPNPNTKKPRVVRPKVPKTPTSPAGAPDTGSVPAKSTTQAVGLPEYRYVSAADINDKGMIAAWQKPSKNNPNGLIEIDGTHPVIVGQVEYWQSQYPKAVHKQIEDIVHDAYADVAIAKVSHMHALTGTIISEEQRDTMLLNPALTTSMLGLISEDALITPRLGGLGTKRKAEESPTDDDNEKSDA